MWLSEVTWDDYTELLRALGDQRLTRVAYNNGVLEIRTPSQLHEIVNRLLAKIIFVLCEELGLECNDLGSTTFNRVDLSQGIEPNSCFYSRRQLR